MGLGSMHTPSQRLNSSRMYVFEKVCRRGGECVVQCVGGRDRGVRCAWCVGWGGGRGGGRGRVVVVCRVRVGSRI
jgi:hypothetical protein